MGASYKLRLLDLALILAHLPSLVAPPALASLSGYSEQVRGSLYIPPALDSPNACASPPPQGEAASMCVCEQMPWLEYSSLCGAHKNKEELTQCTPGSRSNQRQISNCDHVTVPVYFDWVDLQNNHTSALQMKRTCLLQSVSFICTIFTGYYFCCCYWCTAEIVERVRVVMCKGVDIQKSINEYFNMVRKAVEIYIVYYRGLFCLGVVYKL